MSSWPSPCRPPPFFSQLRSSMSERRRKNPPSNENPLYTIASRLSVVWPRRGLLQLRLPPHPLLLLRPLPPLLRLPLLQAGVGGAREGPGAIHNLSKHQNTILYKKMMVVLA